MSTRFNLFTRRNPSVTILGIGILNILIKRLASEKNKNVNLCSNILYDFYSKVKEIQGDNPSKKPFLKYFLLMCDQIRKCEGLLNKMDKLGLTPERNLPQKMSFGFRNHPKNSLISSQRVLPTIDNSRKKRRIQADLDASIVVKEKSHFLEKYKHHDINNYIKGIKAQISKKEKFFYKIYMDLVTSPADLVSICLEVEGNTQFDWDSFIYYLSRKQARTRKCRNQLTKSSNKEDKKSKSKTKTYTMSSNKTILEKLRRLKDLFGNSLVINNFKEELNSEVMCFLTDLEVFANKKFSDGLIDQLSSIDLNCFRFGANATRIFDIFTQKVGKLTRERNALDKSLKESLLLNNTLNATIRRLKKSYKHISRNNTFLLTKMKNLIDLTKMDEVLPK